MSSTDVIFIDALHLAADIGPDCWGRPRPQPVRVSVYLHLRPSFLDTPAASDDVRDSVHYGHLSAAIARCVTDAPPFAGIGALVAAVSKTARSLAGDAARAVRVVVDLPKLILLADNFCVDTTVDAEASLRSVFVRDLVLPVLIGVNPPERAAKQRVVTHIAFHERPRAGAGDLWPLADYPAIVAQIVKNIEHSSYLTLEKFVLEIVRTACLASDDIDRVTVQSHKPSALSFAHSSGVEITRHRADFI